MTSHWSEWPGSRSLQVINAGEGVEGREPSYTVSRRVRLEKEMTTHSSILA